MQMFFRGCHWRSLYVEIQETIFTVLPARINSISGVIGFAFAQLTKCSRDDQVQFRQDLIQAHLT